METSYNQEDDIEFLCRHEHFARFMQCIEAAKDAAIEDMINADTDKLQQISGKIIQINDILNMVGMDRLKEMHRGRIYK